MASSTREYDAFGPWVHEVRTADDVPRLYRDHPLDLAAAHLVLKVPRDIARRDATPAMDLYDHLVTLHPGRLTVLSRWPDPRTPGTGPHRVRQTAVEDVAAVLVAENLLEGRLSVLTRGGDVLDVRYNVSGAESVQRLVDALRALSTGEDAVRAPRQRGLPSLGRDDVAVVSACREVLSRHPALAVEAWHLRQVVAPLGGGPRRLTHALSPMTLQAAIAAADDGALEVFGRRESLVRGRGPVHSLSRLVVPRHALDRVEVAPHPAYEGVTTVTFAAGAARPELAVPDGSGTLRFLRSV